MTNRSLIDLDALALLFPHRVAGAADLIQLGLTGTAVKRRCRPGGPWRRLLPGVLLLTDTPPTRGQLIQAALRYAGDEAIVTGQDALSLHGIRAAAPRGRVHLLVPQGRMVRSGPELTVERTAAPPRPVLRRGLRTAPLARATIDAARRMTSYPEVRTLLAEVVHTSGVRLDELHTELVVGGRRGATLPRQALREIGTRIHATVMASARALVSRTGLPPPRWNVPVDSVDGAPLGSVTGTWDDAGLAWDVHAFDFDPAPAAYPTALKRGSRLAETGLVVLHTAATRLRSCPDTVATELLTAHTQALARPRAGAHPCHQ